MYTFDIGEIFAMAVKIEENGERFYRHLASVAKNKEIVKTFTYLADEEVKHKKIFSDMKAKIRKREAAEAYHGEYLSYLREYVDTLIFTPKKLEDEWSKRKDWVAAIEFGIRRELDSILYYQEIKGFIHQHQRNMVDQIIGEERKHFLKLLELHKLQLKKRQADQQPQK